MIPITQYGFDRHNQKHIDKLKYVLSQYGPKRWRAAANLYLFLNPTDKFIGEDGELVIGLSARQANAIIIKEVAEQRKALDLAGNKFATSSDKNSGRRWGLSMPPGMLQFIELIDPDVLQGTPDERRKSLRDLMETFPEYRIAKEI